MLADMLTLINAVAVNRKTVTYTDGEPSESIVTTIIPRAVMWSPGQSQRYISDKMYRASTDVLVTIPSEYAFSDQDVSVTYNGKTFRITGPSDDVMNLGEICMTGLERLS